MCNFQRSLDDNAAICTANVPLFCESVCKSVIQSNSKIEIGGSRSFIQNSRMAPPSGIFVFLFAFDIQHIIGCISFQKLLFSVPCSLKKMRKHDSEQFPPFPVPCFCIGHSNIWSKPVHSIIKSINDKFNLQWLRVSMSYHRFTNLREILQGDPSRKLTVGSTS